MRIAALMVGLAVAAPVWAQSPVPADEDILAILERRIVEEQQGVGLAVGVVEADGARVVSYGTLGVEDETPVDGDTLFEIGSVNKILTTLLLADAVVRREVTLDQPVADLLPQGVTMPERDGRQITLLDLATYRSGLPRLPDNFAPTDPENPYWDYSSDDLYAFLGSHELTRDIDAEYEYSNLGIGLLGHVLGLNMGADYADLLRERVLDPLEMNETVFVVEEGMQERYAQGHDADLLPVRDWDWDVLAGAGALRSTANDLNKLVSALMGHTETELAEAIALATERHAEIGDGVTGMGLGFHITPLGDDEMVWHNGGTAGARAFVGFLRETGVGVSVLSNVATPHGVDDLGAHLLDASIPLVVPPQLAEVDPAVFAGLEGEYALAPEVMISVYAEGDRLFAALSGQAAARIYPASETEYFYRIVDAQIVFDVDADGMAGGLTLHQFGMEMEAPRVE